MKVGLLDVDGHNFPNLALMKIASYHRKIGDTVEWYSPLFCHTERLYASKIFTFSDDYKYYPGYCDVVKGGTGYDIKSTLPPEIEQCRPDYSIYPEYDYAIGFLTRGCCNKCPWCVVPSKEGEIRIVGDIYDIGVRKVVKLIDNNFLAAQDEFVHEQLKKMIFGKWRIDFNQALDCRKVTPKIACLLAKVKWYKYIRFSCDSDQQFPFVEQAIRYLREAGYNKEVFVYVLAMDIENALNRINKLGKIKNVTPFCMPFRDLSGKLNIPEEIKKLARWCNLQNVRKSIPFHKYDDKIKFKSYMR